MGIQHGTIVYEETEGVLMFDICIVTSRVSCARLLQHRQLYQTSMHSSSHLLAYGFRHLHTTSRLLLCLQ